jgi:hypothetical protein
MLSSIFRPKGKGRRRVSGEFPFASPKKGQERMETRHAAADWTETENDDEETEDENWQNNERRDSEQAGHEGEGPEYGDHEDGEETSPLLPIFSAAHLGWWPLHNTYTTKRR